jgi:hypothetical protein
MEVTVTLFAVKCPVPDRERDWIHQSMRWLVSEFGGAPLSRPVILPNSTYFPPPFSGTDEDVNALVAKVAGYMGVQVDIEVRISVSPTVHLRGVRVAANAQGASDTAGGYEQEDGHGVLTVNRASVRDPVRLVAVIALELAHARLVGEDRISETREDRDPLADLAAIYLGMGIFTANSAFTLRKSAKSRGRNWKANKLGSMTEQMFGYGLACYAAQRQEPDQAWVKHLDTNPRAYMKQGTRYLQHTTPDGTFP